MIHVLGSFDLVGGNFRVTLTRASRAFFKGNIYVAKKRPDREPIRTT